MAAGGVALADALAGADLLFGDALPVYRTVAELDGLLARLDTDAAWRLELRARQGRAVAAYRFSRVAAVLVAHLDGIDRAWLAERVAGRGAPRPMYRRQEGAESAVLIEPERVTKTYNARYAMFNAQYKRRGERYFLERYRSPCLPAPLSMTPAEVVFPNYGEPVGCLDPHAARKYRLHSRGVDLLGLVRWLRELRAELTRLNLVHRDINP